MAGSNASATRSRGRADRSVATFAWSIPSFPTPGSDSPDIDRREAGRSKAYCTKNHRYCDGRCSPSAPAVPPFPGGRARARRRVARLERPPTLLRMLLPGRLPRGTTAHINISHNLKLSPLSASLDASSSKPDLLQADWVFQL